MPCLLFSCLLFPDCLLGTMRLKSSVCQCHAFSSFVVFSPGGHLAMAGGILGCHNLVGGGVWLGWRPGMLPSTLQHNGWSHTTVIQPQTPAILIEKHGPRSYIKLSLTSHQTGQPIFPIFWLWSDWTRYIETQRSELTNLHVRCQGNTH